MISNISSHPSDNRAASNQRQENPADPAPGQSLLERLPVELRQTILDHLPPKDFAAVQNTSRTMYNCVHDLNIRRLHTRALSARHEACDQAATGKDIVRAAKSLVACAAALPAGDQRIEPAIGHAIASMWKAQHSADQPSPDDWIRLLCASARTLHDAGLSSYTMLDMLLRSADRLMALQPEILQQFLLCMVRENWPPPNGFAISLADSLMALARHPQSADLLRKNDDMLAAALAIISRLPSERVPLAGPWRPAPHKNAAACVDLLLQDMRKRVLPFMAPTQALQLLRNHCQPFPDGLVRYGSDVEPMDVARPLLATAQKLKPAQHRPALDLIVKALTGGELRRHPAQEAAILRQMADLCPPSDRQHWNGVAARLRQHWSWLRQL